MAWCPFLSFKVKDITVSRNAQDVTSSIFQSDVGNSTPAAKLETQTGIWSDPMTAILDNTLADNREVIIEQLGALSGTDTINYHTSADNDAPNDIEWTDQGLFVCPESASCQLWDTQNSRCGAKSSDFLNNDTVAESPTAITNILKAIVGDYADRDSDGANLSIYEYLKYMIGTYIERDHSNSLVEYLQDIIGSTSDCPENSFIKEFEQVIGKSSEREEDPENAGQYLSLLTEFLQVVGKSADREEDPDNAGEYLSSMLAFQEVVGSVTEIDVDPLHMIGSLLKSLTHIHNIHWHENDPNHEHPISAGTIKAALLVAEFMANQDMDGGKTPGAATDSIYGSGFMITEDADCPPMIKAIHTHPEWSAPAVSVSWTVYDAI